MSAVRVHRQLSRGIGVSAVVGCALVGCTRISVDPSCPESLRVGESGTVRANEENPGAIATYQWEVFPPDAGSFANPTAAETTFLANMEGGAVIRLTANDGLYVVIEQCHTVVEGFVDVAVSLTAEPADGVVGQAVRLTCLSTGATETESVTIEQIDGASVELESLTPGVARFTSTVAGPFTFECIGTDPDGVESDPVTLTVVVTEPPPANQNDNGTANENTNDNVAANENANDNVAANENANAAAGAVGGG